jgi:acylphosphatase
MSGDPASEPKKRVHAIVHGRVQGVNFRAYTARTARQLDLNGWVRNRPDGTVEVMAEGEAQALTDLLAFLHSGSPSSDVRHVDATWDDASDEFNDFSVRYF